MFRWVEISTKKSQERFELLAAFMNRNGLENSVEFVETTEEEFPAKLTEAMAKYDGIRIGRGLGEDVVPLVTTRSVMVDKIKAADSLVKSHGKWWLRANAVDGFSRVLTRVGEKFDFQSSVLIVGAGAAARVAITSLFMAGFRNFSVSNLDVTRVEDLIRAMSRTHLGAQFRVVLKDELILLPGTHGVLVNTTPLGGDNPMLEELYYFNFFKVGGVAVDFSILPIETPLLKGASEIGAHCLYGYQISAQTDLQWAEQVCGRALEGSSYEKDLETHLRSVK
jgi:shikimate 5-dehydrogenase